MDEYLKEPNSDKCMCGAGCEENVLDLRYGTEIL